MKRKSCPECGSTDLGDRWADGRKLQQYCGDDCSWVGKPRTPEKLRIRAFKSVSVDQFHGHVYEVFDRYGHVRISSQTFGTAAAAERDLLRELAFGKTDREGGPYTGVLWPAKVKVRGKVFR